MIELGAGGLNRACPRQTIYILDIDLLDMRTYGGHIRHFKCVSDTCNSSSSCGSWA